VYYAEGLRERLVEDEAHSTEAAGIFMDTVEELANEVSDEPVNGSQYPVDAGIAEAASQNDLDIVTYDQDFLDENDPITMPEVEVYTPHQATEMMV
jgi:predicted nuclease of predicted toxin-antitoxin system